MTAELGRHPGSCHCGAVRFEVDAPARVVVHACNCSICRCTGHVHLIVPRDRFRLVTGADSLTTYQFNTGVARHTFCSVCGVKGFYIPRSNPDGYSVNMNCLDQSNFEEVTIEPFDGDQWELTMARLGTLSSEASGS